MVTITEAQARTIHDLNRQFWNIESFTIDSTIYGYITVTVNIGGHHPERLQFNLASNGEQVGAMVNLGARR